MLAVYSWDVTVQKLKTLVDNVKYTGDNFKT